MGTGRGVGKVRKKQESTDRGGVDKKGVKEGERGGGEQKSTGRGGIDKKGHFQGGR